GVATRSRGGEMGGQDFGDLDDEISLPRGPRPRVPLKADMDFELSSQAQEQCENMWDFMRSHVIPAESVWASYLAEHGPHASPPVMEELKAEARRRGLWNVFLPKLSGLSNVEYAAVAE